MRDGSNNWMPSTGTKWTTEASGMPAVAGMQATAVTQATLVTPATSNSRNKRSNRSAKTVGTPTNAWTLGKVVKPATACRKANYSSDIIYIRKDSRRYVNSSRTARISRKVSNSR